MKKILFLIVAAIVALMVAGCGAEQTTEQTTEESTTETTVTEEPIVEQTTEETVATEETTETAEETTAESNEEFETVTVEGCTDSDGGKDYATAGTMTDINGIEDSDSCSTNENYPGRLYEVYCKEDGKHGRETYDCPSGVCQSGACGEATE
jgi:outer membrane murein-binding lipoprotein Lpp